MTAIIPPAVASDKPPYPSPDEVVLHIERRLSIFAARLITDGQPPYHLEIYHAIDDGVADAWRAFDARAGK